MCSHWSLIAHGRIGMPTTLRPEVLIVSASDGSVLVDAPGLAVTLDLEAASFLSDELLAACAMARRQLKAQIGNRDAASD
jgi:hypothetical protein